jgi:hypothetical protein
MQTDRLRGITKPKTTAIFCVKNHLKTVFNQGCCFFFVKTGHPLKLYQPGFYGFCENQSGLERFCNPADCRGAVSTETMKMPLNV